MYDDASSINIVVNKPFLDVDMFKLRVAGEGWLLDVKRQLVVTEDVGWLIKGEMKQGV